jgi:hypothetical protein
MVYSNLEPVQSGIQDIPSDSLCTICRIRIYPTVKKISSQADVETVTKKKKKWYTSVTRLRDMSELLSESSEPCELCSFLKAIQPKPRIKSTEWTDEIRKSGYTLYCTSFDCHRDHIKKFGKDQGNMLCVLPTDRQLWNELPQPWRREVEASSCILQCPSSTDQSNSTFTQGSGIWGRLVPSKLDKLDFVKAWISTCELEHGVCGNTDRILPAGFKFIDCFTRMIGDLPIGQPYIALSYVWGGYKPPNRAIHDDLREPLCQVVEDAILIVMKMGLRYLWVDMYCIDQQNLTSKHTQIRMMDSIYHNAALTIINASGDSANSGIPGISSPRPPQPAVKIDGVLYVASKGSPKDDLRASKWYSRGWTLQEAVLSRRRLVFTDNQILFQCQGMVHIESMMWPQIYAQWLASPPSSYMVNSTGNSSASNHKYAFFNSGTDNRIWPLIELYLRKELTYESDALDAFLGILRSHEKHHLNVTKVRLAHIWGLPFPHHRSGLHTMAAFCKNLAWVSRQPLRRRNLLPSWSWAGWALLDSDLRAGTAHNMIESSYLVRRNEVMLDGYGLPNQWAPTVQLILRTGSMDFADWAQSDAREHLSLQLTRFIQLNAYATFLPSHFIVDWDDEGLWHQMGRLIFRSSDGTEMDDNTAYIAIYLPLFSFECRYTYPSAFLVAKKRVSGIVDTEKQFLGDRTVYERVGLIRIKQGQAQFKEGSDSLVVNTCTGESDQSMILTPTQIILG